MKPEFLTKTVYFAVSLSSTKANYKKKNEDSIVGLVSIFPHKHVLKVMKMYDEYK